jgi:hypothetical protein
VRDGGLAALEELILTAQAITSLPEAMQLIFKLGDALLKGDNVSIALSA